MSLQLYKELYIEEWQRRDQLQASAGTPISIVTILGGGLLLMGKSFDSLRPLLYIPFWTAFLAALVCAVVAVYCIVRSVHGYRYERIPHASELVVHQAVLNEHYTSSGRPAEADEAFATYLIRKYIVATDRNAVNNINRGDWLHQAHRWLVYALCTAALAGVPAAVHIKAGPEKPQKIEITNLGSIKMPDTTPSPKPGAAAVPVDAQPSPPEGPPNIIMRRGMKIPPTRDMVLRGEIKIPVR
jgi:hypothetical protein